MTSEFTTRPLTHDDLPVVAAIHTAAFPESALTALGVEAVRRYYAWQLSGPHDVIALGILADVRLIGYLFGGVFRGALSGFVSANRAYLVRRVILRPWLLANPLFRERLALGIRALRGHWSAPQQQVRSLSLPLSPHDTARSFGILSIAVTSDFQSMGAGTVMMGEVETIARQAGCVAMHLTVHPNNIRALQFYERLGWQKAIEESIWRGRMHKALTN